MAIIKIHYSIEPRDRIYVKCYGFFSFAKNMLKNIGTQGKNLCVKYSQKLFDSDKTFTTDAIKTTSKRAIQKTAEATGDLISYKIADQIKSVSKSSKNDLHEANSEIEIPKERYKSSEERQQIIDELRLI